MFIQLVIKENNRLLVEFIFCFLHETNIFTFIRSIYMNIVFDIQMSMRLSYEEIRELFNTYFNFYFSWNEFERLCNENDIPITMFMNPILIYSLFMKLDEMNNFEYKGYNVSYKTDEELNQQILKNFNLYVKKVCDLVKKAFVQIYEKEIPILDINVKGNKTNHDMIEYADLDNFQKKFYT